MPRFFERRAPEGHHRVADVFVERPVDLEDDARHVRKILIEEEREFLRVQFFRNGGEAANVAEHHGDVGFLWVNEPRIRPEAAESPPG